MFWDLKVPIKNVIYKEPQAAEMSYVEIADKSKFYFVIILIKMVFLASAGTEIAPYNLADNERFKKNRNYTKLHSKIGHKNVTFWEFTTL